MEILVLLHLIILLSGVWTQTHLLWERTLSDDSQHFHTHQAHSSGTDFALLRSSSLLGGSGHVTLSRYVDFPFRNSTYPFDASGEAQIVWASDDQPQRHELFGDRHAPGLSDLIHSMSHTLTFTSSWFLTDPQIAMEKAEEEATGGDAGEENSSPVVTAQESTIKTPLVKLLKKLGDTRRDDAQSIFLMELLETFGGTLSPRHSGLVVETLKALGVEAQEDFVLLSPAFLALQAGITPMQMLITETFLRDKMELFAFRTPSPSPSVTFAQSEGPYKREDARNRRDSSKAFHGDRSSIGSATSTISNSGRRDRSTRKVHADRRSSNILQPSDFDDIAGWEHAPEHANLETHNKDPLTKEGKELQKDYRKKVAINATKQLPDFDGKTESW